MKHKSYCLFFLPFLFLLSCTSIPDSQWRGPERNGIFHETGLLQEWPDDGPELLWRYDSLLMGHSSPAVTEKGIYVTGMPDSTSGYLFCLSHQGELLWKVRYGDEYKTNYTGSRSTPIVRDNNLYLMSGLGEVICFDLKTQKKLWTCSMSDRFGAVPVNYGNAESVLLDKNQLFCNAGGETQCLVCLDPDTGETLWTTKGNGEGATYSSAIMVEHDKTKMVIAVMEKSVIAVEAQTGKLLWRVPFEPIYINHANTPVYNSGIVYMSGAAGEDKGGFIAIELNRDGTDARIKWQRTDIPNNLSGFMINDTCIFSTGGRRAPWQCYHAQTGETLGTWEDFSEGNISFADKRYYILTQKGEVLLCKAAEKVLTVVSRFQPGVNIYDPFAPLWAYPVIHNKKLYIRHKGTLFVYDIAVKNI